MRGLNTVSAAGATNLALGDLEFINAGQQVYVKGHDSVATATLRVVFAGVELFTGPLAIEPGTDVAPEWTRVLTTFVAPQNGNLSAILGGTVAGARVDFLVLNPNERQPF